MAGADAVRKRLHAQRQPKGGLFCLYAFELRAIFNNPCAAGPAEVFETNRNFLHPRGAGGWLPVRRAATGRAVPDASLSSAGPIDPQRINTWIYRGESCSVPAVLKPINATQEGDL